MTRTIKQRIEPIFLHATPLESVIIPHSRVKKWHRKKAKPKPANHKPAKAILPEGKYFYKKQRRNFKKWEAKKSREEGTRRKRRGAKKKEALRKYRLEFPKGRPYAKKPAPKHRGVIFPGDLERFMHLTPRGARAYLGRVKKKLKKDRDHLVTVQEFCDHKKIPIEDIIPYLL
jgi:hypothetical protein